MFKKSLIFFIISIIIACVCLPAGVAAFAESIDHSSVTDDLSKCMVDGKPFDFADYPYNANGSLKLLTLSESAYSYTDTAQTKYGLFAYIYNPQKTELDTASLNNKIQMATAYDGEGKPSDYEKFDLRFVSVSAGQYDRLFYKFKVVDRESLDGLNIGRRINRNARRYDISGIELVTIGYPNANDYEVGGTYIYTGYQKGFGADPAAASTLSCQVKNLETVELQVNSTYYRSGVSSAGVGHYSQINSVFFALDADYGNVKKIKAEWWEYKTSPIIMTSDAALYQYMRDYIGVKVPDYSNNIKYSLYLNYLSLPSGLTSTIDSAAWAWNGALPVGCMTRSNLLSYLFSTNGTSIDNYRIDSEALKTYMKNYSVYETGRLPIKNQTISADLFLSLVDSGHTRGYNVMTINAGDNFDVLSYKTTHTGWEMFWAGFWGKGLSQGDDYLDKDPIYVVSAADFIGTDAQVSSRLMINERDVDSLRTYYASAALTGKSVYLLRYSVTDYYNKMLRVTENKFLGSSNNTTTSYSTETVFFDFDIIQLTLYKNGKYIEMPVVSDPVNIIGDIENILPQIESWWKLILGAIFVILLIVILGPLLPGLIRFLWFIVTIPYRVLGGLFKMIGRGLSRTEKK